MYQRQQGLKIWAFPYGSGYPLQCWVRRLTQHFHCYP
jgi:hypothetical protein